MNAIKNFKDEEDNNQKKKKTISNDNTKNTNKNFNNFL